MNLIQRLLINQQTKIGAQIPTCKETTLQLNNSAPAPLFFDSSLDLLRKYLIRKENFNSRAEFFKTTCCKHFIFDHNKEGKCLIANCQACKGIRLKQIVPFARMEITTLDSKFWKLVEIEIKSWKDRGY